ncbi:MAG: DNA methyltransferase, partial [Nitrososphaerota archaeon]
MEEKIANFKGKRMIRKAKALNSNWTSSVGEFSNGELVLLDNVQFIYELALAWLELQSLEADFDIANGLREFRLTKAKDEEKLRRRLAYFKLVMGKFTDYFYIVQKNRTNSVNQYLTHWIYPYKGKFHPQMVRALLNIIRLEPGDTVLDPFVGSGTTALEAQLLGINCIGIDISPLCVLQSKVKTESLSVLPLILEQRKEIMKEIGASSSLAKKSIDDIINSISHEKVKNFYMIAKLAAISDNVRRGREFSAAFLRNVELMISSVLDYVDIIEKLNLRIGNVDIKIGDARALPLENESIDGIITSPPYSIALDYVANDAHAFTELGYNLSEIKETFIGVRGR